MPVDFFSLEGNETSSLHTKPYCVLGSQASHHDKTVPFHLNFSSSEAESHHYEQMLSTSSDTDNY